MDLPTSFCIRKAALTDVSTILDFIKELAVYEKLEHEVVATEALLKEHLFGEQSAAEVILGENGGVAVGFALYFYSFSTFLGRPGMYLEDLFVKEEFRGHGYGKALLAHLATLAVEGGYGRLEWSVLNWNEPAIEFYKSLEAKPLDGWTTYRLAGKQLDEVSRLIN